MSVSSNASADPVSEMQLRRFHEFRRKSLARQFCYGDRLKNVRKYNKMVESVLAFVTASTVVGLGVWKFAPAILLEIIIAIFAVLALILSIIKTQWNLVAEIRRYSLLHYSYSLIETDFEELEFSVERTKNMTADEFEAQVVAALRRRKKIIQDEDPDIKERICQNDYVKRVDVLLPEENWSLTYIPPAERLSKITKDGGI
ncbi:MAG: hypothetical protein ACFFG0_38620 [Candidatus Thorarchaeota archaeon]